MQVNDTQAIHEGRVPPFFRMGQIVAAYADPQQGIFISYGNITAMKWFDGCFCWVYEILTTPHNTTIKHMQSHVREVSPSEARQLFTPIINPLATRGP
jgi:hypothetical protein